MTAEGTRKNIVFMDWQPEEGWGFLKGLEEGTGEAWELACFENRYFGGAAAKIRRLFGYFRYAFKILRGNGGYAKVLAWQQYFGLALAALMRLFHVKDPPKIYIMTFIYKPRKNKAVEHMHRAFVRYALMAGCVQKAVVFSKSEAGYYPGLLGVPEGKFASAVVGTEDEAEGKVGLEGAKAYYVAAGRSNRDYAFLIQAWPQDGPELHIICDTGNVADTGDMEGTGNQGNILYLPSCYGEGYLKEIESCRAVILSLDDPKISSGQLVALQAFMFGKPIVATKGSTITDYVEDGANGLVIEKTPGALLEALGVLEVPSVYAKLSANARASFEERFTWEAMGKSVGEAISEP